MIALRFGRSIALCTRVTTAAVSILLSTQTAQAQDGFEVASVKHNDSGNSAWSISYSADSLRATNATLSALIQSAYGILLDDRLVGGPRWVRTTRFDVSAKAEQATPRDQLRLMAQRLLEDRFGLVLRTEWRQQDVYALRLARADGRTGPDLHPAADDCDREAPTRSIPRSSTGLVPTTWGRCTTMTMLATGLTRSLGFAVVDETGLAGRWDFVLVYSALLANPCPAAEPVQADLPTVFVALEEQLGLRLGRNARGAVDYTVIVSAHAPTGD